MLEKCRQFCVCIVIGANTGRMIDVFSFMSVNSYACHRISGFDVLVGRGINGKQQSSQEAVVITDPRCLLGLETSWFVLR